ncbi:MAG: hypothetical protein E7425_10590 [Ruminococcaceae bacterium]|nr:hypothetical protein [Oscillospiraceae bacterium]
MKNIITISARAFPVMLRDERTGETSTDVIALSKEQLQAAQLVGESSTELVYRIYNRQGFRVLDVGKPYKQNIGIDLTELHERQEATAK